MEPRPPALGLWSLRHWTTREVPLVVVVVVVVVVLPESWLMLMPASLLWNLPPIWVELPKRPSLWASTESSSYWPTKRIMIQPGIPIYQLPLTSGVLHQLMPFSCLLITPFWMGGEEGLELDSASIRWSSSPRWMVPGNRDWWFVSISIALTPGRARHGRGAY